MTQQIPVKESNESLEFRAQVQQLLHILAHSLYKDREIFLRELISNASDALHRVQFEMLTNRQILDPKAELSIHIEFDEEEKTLTISDSGIGMTHDELIESLGTIAQSGARAFLQNLEEGQRSSDIIGQFGVGFYSVFTVAQEVEVVSRSFQPETQAWSWTSQGIDTFNLSPADKSERGTSIKIKLKEDASDFASAWKLEQIIKKHSDFVSFPIYVGEKSVNQQTALWRQSPQDIEDVKYTDFYRQLTLDFESPLLHVHLVSDAPVHVRSVLYIPRRRERPTLALRTDHGLELYSRKVLIQEYNKDLLPNHFRFVEGVVDSEDIPLNVSRETVQSSRTMRQLGKALNGRLLKSLNELAENQPDDYQVFWQEFGAFIKEGVTTDPNSRDDLLPLLRFHSSHTGDELISLSGYVERMAENQQAIYYILGQDLESVARSPHLDYFRAHDLQVLYLVDPIDSFMVSNLREFEGKALKNVDDAGLDLPTPDKADEQASNDVEQADLAQLIGRFLTVLGERVSEVRESKLLTDSPCRLVTPEDSPDRDMQRVRRMLDQDYEIPKKILEINRRHSLIRNLTTLFNKKTSDALVDLVIEQLYENAMLLEGLHPNPAQMAPRIQSLLETAISGAMAE